jgi:hypothetical protein
MKKIPYPAFGNLELRGEIYRIKSGAHQCPGDGKNKCVYLCPFYGFDTIGPRVYAVYRGCGSHTRFFRVRIFPKKV